MITKDGQIRTERALKLALAVLKEWRKGFPDDWTDFDTEAVTAIEEALTESALERMAKNEQELGLNYMEQAQQQEPCGWRMKHNGAWTYSFTEDAWDFVGRIPKAQHQQPSTASQENRNDYQRR